MDTISRQPGGNKNKWDADLPDLPDQGNQVNQRSILIMMR
jgi:hypothetical protein